MKCQVCKKSVKDFREHALNHVRADEAYAVETWDPKTASATLVLYPLRSPFTVGEVTQLRKKFKTRNTRLITGTHLRMLEGRHKGAK